MPRLFRSFFLLALVVCAGSPGCDPTPPTQGDPPPSDSSSKGSPPDAKCEPAATPTKQVLLIRTPDGGIQPQVFEHKGTHLIYFKGDPKGGDVYYVKIKPNTLHTKPEFSKPLRVNSQPGSVLALGNIRGAQLAVSDSGRVHVAWVGSAKAEPKAPGKETPMLYTRLNDAGTAFEPQRNLVHEAVGIDGGSIAAHGQDIHVYWHAAEPGKKGEVNRRIWRIASGDDGKTFAKKEQAISPAETGVCGCCGIHAYNLVNPWPVILYRSAVDGVHRDTYFLHQNMRTARYEAVKLDAWKTEQCPMSTFSLDHVHEGWLAAWETKGQVYYGHLDYSGKLVQRYAAPGKGEKRKHPVVRFNGRHILFAWTEGMDWNKGGAVAWQLYDVREGKDTPVEGTPALTNTSGREEGVPPWSLITAARVNDSQFVIFY